MRKLLLQILILVILAGLFSPTIKVAAQSYAIPGGTSYTPANASATGAAADAAQAAAAQEKPPTTGDTFKDEAYSDCGAAPWKWPACFLSVGFYYLFVGIPSILLWLSAQFFNSMVAIGISSSITSTASFIPKAWGVVRDLSNIFFILILLYVAIQTILGLSHEAKKIVVKVIIIALLINFSMFFTKVVIDTSNILALVFYSKLDENQPNPAGRLREYTPVTVDKTDKDLSGFLYKNFDATQLLSGPSLNKLKETQIDGKIVTGKNLPLPLKIGIILIAGAIMLFAAYAFFVSAFMFIGRLVELWVLIIFAPFAFMSSTIPKLAGVEYLGWDSWLKRLISTSFMAPIFMFFMYLIFSLVNSDIFTRFPNSTNASGALANILGILIPAMIILALLLKATSYAKKGGGQFGEMIVRGGMALGGLALGAATGGAALAATSTVGSLASRAASSGALNAKAKEKGFGGIMARQALKTADYGSKASFDLRMAPGVHTLAKAGGISLGKVKEGGYERVRAEKVKARQKRAEEFEVREDETVKQNLNKVKEDLQSLLQANAHEIEMIDKQITTARQKLRDATATFGGGSPQAKEFGAALADLKGQRSARKNATIFTTSTGERHDFTRNTVGGVVGGASINDLEDNIIPHAEHELHAESQARKRAYADRIDNKWFKTRANREAAHKIRIGAKISSGGDDKGHEVGGHSAPAAHHEPAADHGGGGHGGGDAGHGGGGHH